MTLSQAILAEFENEAGSTRKILERIPDGKLSWKPHEKSMTLGRLAGHIAELPAWIVSTVELDSLTVEPGDYKAFAADSQPELLGTFDKYVSEARRAIKTVTDDHLQKVWTLTIQGRQVFSMPRHAVLQSFLLNHMIHHRGQLSVYLRLLDVTVPGMYGSSADEM